MKTSLSSKKYLLKLFVVSLLLVLSFYFILSSYSYKMGLEFFNGWKESEIVQLQQGNYLSSLTKTQRSLMSSGQLIGILLYDLKGKRELIQYGTTSKLSEIPVVGFTKIEKRGFFSFSIAEVFNENTPMLVQFDFNPKIIWLVFIGLLVIILIFSLLLWVQIRKIEKNEFKEREKIVTLAIHDLIQNEKLSDVLVEKVPFLVQKWTEIKSELAKAQEIQAQSLISLKLAEIAQQVSHDIRSPLSALNMMLMDLKELPEQKRVIVRSALQRINDISNTLLEKSKGQAVGSSTQSSPLHGSSTPASSAEVVLLSSMVGELLSEKRIQFREKIGVSIEEDLTRAYGYFVSVNATEIKRVLSNLINNSIEAFPEGKGRVTLGIRGYKEIVQIIISDNGKGIPASVLAKLGERGVSHGKESSGTSGSGLGVYHAKSTVEGYGGKFEIQSREGHGTLIQIQLPRVAAPTWFVEELCLKPGMKIFTLDDDSNIHEIWKERFLSLDLQSHGITLSNYTNANKMMESFQKLSDKDRANALYLVDYEFLDQDLHGIEVIQKLGIQNQSILVTSHADRTDFQKQCQDLGLRLIPKSMSHLIPIKKNENV